MLTDDEEEEEEESSSLGKKTGSKKSSNCVDSVYHNIEFIMRMDCVKLIEKLQRGHDHNFKFLSKMLPILVLNH